MPLPAMSGAEPCTASKIAASFADVRARRHAEPAHQPGDQVGQDVAEEVGGDDHVELPRVEHELHRAGVDDPVVACDPALVLLRHLARGLEEEAGQRLQHVGLVDDRDLLAAVLHRVVERELGDPPRPGARVHAGGDRHRVRVAVDRDVVLEARRRGPRGSRAPARGRCSRSARPGRRSARGAGWRRAGTPRAGARSPSGTRRPPASRAGPSARAWCAGCFRGAPAAADRRLAWTAAIPPCCVSHSNGAPSASRISTTAAVISGPMPSPGMSVAGIFAL